MALPGSSHGENLSSKSPLPKKKVLFFLGSSFSNVCVLGHFFRMFVSFWFHLWSLLASLVLAFCLLHAHKVLIFICMCVLHVCLFIFIFP